MELVVGEGPFHEPPTVMQTTINGRIIKIFPTNLIGLIVCLPQPRFSKFNHLLLSQLITTANMRIIELVIDGFKSYAVRTVISGWDESFNSITGLNGSGKSNILDAICFVLGITSMSTVRAQNIQASFPFMLREVLRQQLNQILPRTSSTNAAKRALQKPA